MSGWGNLAVQPPPQQPLTLPLRLSLSRPLAVVLMRRTSKYADIRIVAWAETLGLTTQKSIVERLAVQSAEKDPYLLDTSENHAIGAWVQGLLDSAGGRDHSRNLHYGALGIQRPDGQIYTSTDANWNWMKQATKVARWLKYVPFDAIPDERNSEPIIRITHEPQAVLIPGGVDLEYVLPQAELDLRGIQPYRIALFGEKTGLEAVMGPLADEFSTDLLLQAGDGSDNHLHQLARAAAEDGRCLLLFTVCDSDPSGWNMPIVLARKLQAFRDQFFPNLEFKVFRIGLTADQVKAYAAAGDALPTSPLKPSEKRADRWRRATGTEQTEINALMVPHRRTDLAQMIRDALNPWFDASLAETVADLRDGWIEEASAAIDDALLLPRDRIRVLAEEITRATDVTPSLPPVPGEPVGSAPGSPLVPLADSGWDWLDLTNRLNRDRNYGGEA